MDYSTMGKLGYRSRIQKQSPHEMTAAANLAQRTKLTQRIDPDGSLQRDDPALFNLRYKAELSARGIRAAEARWGAERRKKAFAALTQDPGNLREITTQKTLCAWCATETGQKVGRYESSSICAPHRAKLMAKAAKIQPRDGRLQPDATR